MHFVRVCGTIQTDISERRARGFFSRIRRYRTGTAMKSYKFKFSKLIFVLMIAGIVLAAGGIALTVFRIIRAGFATVSLGITHVLVLLVCALLLVILPSILIRSAYQITDKELILWFGIIKSSYKISEMESIHLFTKTNKLVIYFKNDRYTVIVVKPEWYNEFTKELLSKNDKIRYDVSTTDGTDDIG